MSPFVRKIMSVPKHIAIILDGNGRWARSKGMPRTYGHTIGAKNVETIARAAKELGVEYMTLYAFSTENWNRPSDEVKALMVLLGDYLKDCIERASKNKMRVRVIGDISRLESDLQDKIRQLEKESAIYDGFNLTIAINYGSRDEIVRAVRKIAQKQADGLITSDEIDEKMISDNLDTGDLPDPDLMIRTSGEQRLSNYLLWQLAYAEFYFTDVPWPAFSKKDLKQAIEAYENRDRRYGKV